MPPDFVINVYYDNFGDKAGHSELSMKVGVRGDAVEADRLHTKLFSALILSNSPYEAFRKFTQEHDLPYLSKLDE